VATAPDDQRVETSGLLAAAVPGGGLRNNVRRRRAIQTSPTIVIAALIAVALVGVFGSAYLVITAPKGGD